jgi:hypothetical protein
LSDGFKLRDFDATTNLSPSDGATLIGGLTSAIGLGYTATAMRSAMAGSIGVTKGGLQYSDDLLNAAQKAYPKLAGKSQLHHITPKYLGGPANGPLIKLDAAYHQQITNAFRAEWGYGLGKPSAAQLQTIMNKVYSQFPLPK